MSIWDCCHLIHLPVRPLSSWPTAMLAASTTQSWVVAMGRAGKKSAEIRKRGMKQKLGSKHGGNAIPSRFNFGNW